MVTSCHYESTQLTLNGFLLYLRPYAKTYLMHFISACITRVKLKSINTEGTDGAGVGLVGADDRGRGRREWKVMGRDGTAW
jgi:hypothetical protein